MDESNESKPVTLQDTVAVPPSIVVSFEQVISELGGTINVMIAPGELYDNFEIDVGINSAMVQMCTY